MLYYPFDNGRASCRVRVDEARNIFSVTSILWPADPVVIWSQSTKTTELIGEFEDDDDRLPDDKVLIPPTSYIRCMVGEDGCDFGGSLLIELTLGRYMFICGNIFSFYLEDDVITSFHSPVGNNAVPYPYAMSKARTYLMMTQLGFSYIENTYDIKEDPYAVVYGHSQQPSPIEHELPFSTEFEDLYNLRKHVYTPTFEYLFGQYSTGREWTYFIKHSQARPYVTELKDDGLLVIHFEMPGGELVEFYDSWNPEQPTPFIEVRANRLKHLIRRTLLKMYVRRWKRHRDAVVTIQRQWRRSIADR
jgi:hypothetical protein